MSLRGIVSGALLLIALEVIVSSEASATRFGQMLTGVGTLTRHLLSPTVPAIPDLTGNNDS
jgi:hypothetical protein